MLNSAGVTGCGAAPHALTVSEPGDVLLEGQQVRGEAALQGEVAPLLHPAGLERGVKLGLWFQRWHCEREEWVNKEKN